MTGKKRHQIWLLERLVFRPFRDVTQPCPQSILFGQAVKDVLSLYPGTGCMMVGMKTGELARQAGVNIQTIRFYERERLLGAPPRTPAGYRCYSRGDLQRVVFIRTCQQLGFTLEDIRSLAGLHDRLVPGAGGCAEEAGRLGIAAIAQQRLRQIDEKLRQLSEMRAHLQALCDASAPVTELRCPATRLQNSS